VPATSEAIFSFIRKYPFVDIGMLAMAWWLMRSQWKSAAYSAEESDPHVREVAAAAVTSQINGMLTSASIVLTGIGAVLAIGLGKSFPMAAFDHLIVGAAWALGSIALGVYTLGYLPSPTVLNTLNVSRKASVQLAWFTEINLIVLAALRFLLALWHLPGGFLAN
jgi:hypothetical protein